MKSLKKNIVTRRLASFALAFMLSLGLVTTYVSPVMAAESNDTYVQELSDTATSSTRATAYYPC